MTREEAIKGLKVLHRDFSGYKPNEEMFDMAIKALEQEPILDKIRAEIEHMPSELTEDGRRMVRRVSVFQIIDKYKAESEDKE